MYVQMMIFPALLQIIVECISVASIPAFVMLCGSLFAICSPKQPSKKVAHAIQRFAAGILTSAIASELIPTISAAKGTANLIGIVVGFTLGAAVMSVLPILLGEEQNEKGSHQKLVVESEDGPASEEKQTAMLPLTVSDTSVSRIAKIRMFCKRIKSRISYIFEGDTDKNTQNALAPFPAVFAAAVYIDSLMDGLLVGISLLSGARYLIATTTSR
jgi:zinc transporter ZupT